MKKETITVNGTEYSYADDLATDLQPIVEEYSQFQVRITDSGEEFARLESSMNTLTVSKNDGSGNFTISVQGTDNYVDAAAEDVEQMMGGSARGGGVDLGTPDNRNIGSQDTTDNNDTDFNFGSDRGGASGSNVDATIKVMQDGTVEVESTGRGMTLGTDFGFIVGNGEVKFGYVSDNVNMTEAELDMALSRVKSELMDRME